MPHPTPKSIEQKIQSQQYSWPYHYFPQNSRDDGFTLHVELGWGLTYFATTEFIIRKIEELPFLSLLDFGCGDGRLINELGPRHPEASLLGQDFDERATALARLFSRTPNTLFTTDDLATLHQKHAAGFDIVTSIEVIEHIPPDDLPAVVNALHGIIKPNGYLLLTVPSDNVPLNKKHFQHFNEKKLHTLFSEQFTLLESQFIARRGRRSRIYRKMLTNSWFTTKARWIRDMAYRGYRKHCVLASPSDGTRILQLYRKQP